MQTSLFDSIVVKKSKKNSLISQQNLKTTTMELGSFLKRVFWIATVTPVTVEHCLNNNLIAIKLFNYVH